ncbi:hypothetical protein GCM10009665_42520 [Kitasatospora nipponensis]|uniref:MFS transporter n=1 Tax=Kitasatospora nipponensis TaxID=258049 RepID=A0ABP4H1M5_9ACTN
MGTGQTAARFFCSLGFGTAWTAFGPHDALALAAGGLVLAAAVAFPVLRPARPDRPGDGPPGDDRLADERPAQASEAGAA